MKILFYIHGYPPTHNAGAEWMAYDMADFFKQRHTVRILTQKAQPGYQEGVDIVQVDLVTLKKHFQWADKIITHLDFTPKAHNICRYFGWNNLYVIIHNTFTNNLLQNRPNEFHAIYNSVYTAGLKLPQPSVICRPPLVAERYKATGNQKREYITLVNCYEPKGGQILADLAKIMPDQKFIGVLGGYGDQIRGDSPNITYIENNANIADIYSRTKILIQPSTYESYGKAACEALVQGIPVVSTATPGLQESMGEAGVFAERTAESFKQQIEMVLNDYDFYSHAALNRAEFLVKQTRTDLYNLEKFLMQMNDLRALIRFYLNGKMYYPGDLLRANDSDTRMLLLKHAVERVSIAPDWQEKELKPEYETKEIIPATATKELLTGTGKGKSNVKRIKK